MALLSRVTAPFSAISEPESDAPVLAVIDVCARMIPINAVFVPNVAELPTCQMTLHALAPLINITDDAEAVVSVVPIWKTNWALVSPWASSVSIPVSCAEELKKYTPGVSVKPPRSIPVSVAVGASPAATL
jgi:hypothetical protein